MKNYKYTLLKMDGTTKDLGTGRKKDFAEMYKILNCQTIEIIPEAYYQGLGWNRCSVYTDEEARFNSNNLRNKHFKVLRGNPDFGEPLEWDVVGNAIKEEVA
jgi:hypothetical protein